MKKLNITKEQFDKSRYLKHKYGNLKFVSESGKLFKTDTGKILKFVKESVEYDYQLVKDWVKRAKTAVVDATVGLMDEQSKKILLDDAIECLRLLDDAFEDSATDLAGTKFHINETPSVVDTQADPAPVEPLQEVNESKLSNIDLTQAEVDVIDKVGEESKCDWFGLCGTDDGRWYVRDFANETTMGLKEGLDELCQGACNGGDWTELFGLTLEEVKTWNNLIDKLGLDPSYKGDEPKAVNEGSDFATIEDFDPNEPGGEFILTVVDQNGSEEEIHFYMDVAEDWGNVNNDAGCFWPCDEDATDVEYFDGVGFGNDEDGYKKVVKVVSVDLDKEMTPEDFGDLCDQYVDWFSA